MAHGPFDVEPSCPEAVSHGPRLSVQHIISGVHVQRMGGGKTWGPVGQNGTDGCFVIIRLGENIHAVQRNCMPIAFRAILTWPDQFALVIEQASCRAGRADIADDRVFWMSNPRPEQRVREEKGELTALQMLSTDSSCEQPEFAVSFKESR